MSAALRDLMTPSAVPYPAVAKELYSSQLSMPRSTAVLASPSIAMCEDLQLLRVISLS